MEFEPRSPDPKSYIHLQVPVILLLIACSYSYTSTSQICKYGPRGSLTAICVNATNDLFKVTNYRFDYLDETLQCLNCSLTSLTQGTFDIPGNEIKNLDIRNSSVTQIWPKAFVGMIYMEKLFLSHNPIEAIYPQAFQGVRKVKYLELENSVNHLEPNIFEELHLLEVLILSNNKLQEIKEATFEGLYNLRILDLSYNELKDVRNSFQPLVKLKILKLSHNSIRVVYGNEFNALKSLWLLNLEYNLMYTFSTNISSDNSLRTLHLSHNSLTASSFKADTFSHLNNLEELNLSDNEFISIPVRLFQGLYKLRIIDLNQNYITSLSSGSFAGLPHLRVLNISSNKIQDLKVTGRFSLPSLVILDLSRNQIVDFNYLSLILRTPKLRYIDLKHNELSCNLVSKLEVLFENDSINFEISAINDFNSCPKLDKESAASLIQENTEQIEYRLVNNTMLIWMFVLITLVILFIGVLFYIQFFIIIRVGPKSHTSIRILKTFGTKSEEVI